MFYELSKLLNIFVISPISWMFILLVAGYLLRKRKGVRAGCWTAALCLFLVFGNASLYERVRHRCFRKYAKAELVKPHYEMAIVMGGFGEMNRETGQFCGNQRADRLWEAVRLYKEGKVGRILITGDATSNIVKGDSDKDVFLRYMDSFGMPDTAFVFEQYARNSRENAVNTVTMLRQMDIPADSCLLVTSMEHMGRSLGCFAKTGFEPDWYSVGIKQMRNDRFTVRTLYPDWDTMVRWQSLFNEWVGDMAYKVMGYV